MKPFQELNIFENQEINSLCDRVFMLIRQVIGSPPILCGSVAKMFANTLDQNYRPKDIDFYVSKRDFQKLLLHLPKEIEGVRMIEKRPERILLHSLICIEIWKDIQEDNHKRGFLLKNNQIPYKNYGNKI